MSDIFPRKTTDLKAQVFRCLDWYKQIQNVPSSYNYARS